MRSRKIAMGHLMLLIFMLARLVVGSDDQFNFCQTISDPNEELVAAAASREGDWKTVEALLRCNETDVNYVGGRHDLTALMAASMNGHLGCNSTEILFLNQAQNLPQEMFEVLNYLLRSQIIEQKM